MVVFGHFGTLCQRRTPSTFCYNLYVMQECSKSHYPLRDKRLTMPRSACQPAECPNCPPPTKCTDSRSIPRYICFNAPEVSQARVLAKVFSDMRLLFWLRKPSTHFMCWSAFGMQAEYGCDKISSGLKVDIPLPEEVQWIVCNCKQEPNCLGSQAWEWSERAQADLEIGSGPRRTFSCPLYLNSIIMAAETLWYIVTRYILYEKWSSDLEVSLRSIYVTATRQTLNSSITCSSSSTIAKGTIITARLHRTIFSYLLADKRCNLIDQKWAFAACTLQISANIARTICLQLSVQVLRAQA